MCISYPLADNPIHRIQCNFLACFVKIVREREPQNTYLGGESSLFSLINWTSHKSDFPL